MRKSPARTDKAALIQPRPAEKRKLIFLSVITIMVLVAVIVARLQESSLREKETGLLPTGSVEEQVLLPQLDVTQLEESVRDSNPADRALTDAEALNTLADYARLLHDQHFAAMDVRLLDNYLRDAILADPSGHRAQPFLVRGFIDAISTRKRRPDAPEEHFGVLRTENEAVVHFTVLRVPNATEVGDPVALRGLFLKAYTIEDPKHAGEWLEGPLLVGPRLEQSWPALEDSSPPSPQALALVRDDTATLITGIPNSVQWQMMAYARDLPPDAIDWDAAPELNNEFMTEILKDGSTWRGGPVRIPVSKNMGTWVAKAEENPARLEEITLGWIGNWTWTNAAGVIHFRAPFVRPDLQALAGDARYITARGFFLKNWAYEPVNGGLRVAPLFIMHSMDVHIPEPDLTVTYLMYGVAVAAVFLTFLIWFMLFKDKQKSAALEQELIRRRRARRERQS